MHPIETQCCDEDDLIFDKFIVETSYVKPETLDAST